MSMRILVLALALAIGVQNTCPHGWAAKTAFVSCQKTRCPMKGHGPSKSENQADTKPDLSNIKQAFVLDIARPDNAFQELARTERPVPVASPGLKEIFSDPLFRPPMLPSLV